MTSSSLFKIETIVVLNMCFDAPTWMWADAATSWGDVRLLRLGKSLTIRNREFSLVASHTACTLSHHGKFHVPFCFACIPHTSQSSLGLQFCEHCCSTHGANNSAMPRELRQRWTWPVHNVAGMAAPT